MKKLLFLPVALFASTSLAAPRISAQSIIVNPVQPDLSVQVRVDKDSSGNANPTYLIGESIKISASTNRDAYVYLFNVSSDGEVTQILPNRLQSGGNFIRASTTVTFPSVGDQFTFDIDGPVGLNKVLALASLTELNLNQVTNFKSNQESFAIAKSRGQDRLAQALSVVVNPIAQNTWVTDTAFFTVGSRTPIRTGSLFVGTNVVGSTVILNGRTLGGANTTYSGLQPGSYPVRVKAPGYSDFTSTVRIEPNATTNLNVEFNRPAVVTPVRQTPPVAVVTPVRPVAPSIVVLDINSSVNGARVFINGTEVGTISNGGLSLNVPRGTHEVVMVAPGFRTYVNTVSISNNATLTINPSR